LLGWLKPRANLCNQGNKQTASINNKFKFTIMKVTQKELQNRISDSLDSVGVKTAKQYFDFAKEDKALEEIHDKAVEAGLLGNFERIMDEDIAQTFIKTNNYGPYVMEIWPVVTAWYPEFPLKDLISVQDMNKPLAYLFFSSLKAANSKAPTAVGARVETPLGLRDIRGQYPTGEIMGEEIPTAQLEFDATEHQTIALLAYNPLNVTGDYLEKFKITLKKEGADDVVLVPAAVVNGKITLNKKVGTTLTATESYLDIETGALYVAEDANAAAASFDKVIANYVWQIELSVDENIPSVIEDIEMLPMEAVPRAIALKWTIFAEYIKKSQFKTDIREENTKRVLNLIYQFQVRYILDSLYDFAEGTEVTITIPGSTVMSVEVKSQAVQVELKKVANTIELESGRQEGNRIVCGKNFKSFVESLPSTLFKPAAPNTAFSGPREIGTYGSFKVYYDNTRGDDEAFMTYRGTEWYDAAYYMGMFMPIVPTDAVALGTKVREAFCSMEAYKFHKKRCVVPIKFVFG